MNHRYIQLDHKTGDITLSTYDTVTGEIDGFINLSIHLQGTYDVERSHPSYREPDDYSTVEIEYDSKINFDIEFKRVRILRPSVRASPYTIQFEPLPSLDSFIDACTSDGSGLIDDDGAQNPITIARQLSSGVTRAKRANPTNNQSGTMNVAIGSLFNNWLNGILSDSKRYHSLNDLTTYVKKHCDRFDRAELPRYMK